MNKTQEKIHNIRANADRLWNNEADMLELRFAARFLRQYADELEARSKGGSKITNDSDKARKHREYMRKWRAKQKSKYFGLT